MKPIKYVKNGDNYNEVTEGVTETDPEWYAYRITEKPTEIGDYSGKIEVVFLEGTSNYYYENGQKKQAKVATDESIEKGTDYIVHPGFTFGDEELTGIWVAKFEASHSDAEIATDETAPATGTSTKVKIQPNVISWRYINVANIFDTCYNMRMIKVTVGQQNQTLI